MQLNPDCVRDILFEIERVSTFRDRFRYPGEVSLPRLEKYTVDEVMYHVRQCEQSRLIYDLSWFMNREVMVKDLTPTGHQFLADIRSDNNWKAVKEKAAKVGSFSLGALQAIATGIVTALINKQVGI